MPDHSTTIIGNDNKPLVSMHYPRLVARVIHLKEKELDRLLSGTGIRPDRFMDEDARLTTDQTVTISLNAMAMCDDPGLGLRVGKSLSPATYGPLGFLVSASPNLSIAINHFKTLLPTRIPFVIMETRENQQGMVCQLSMQFTDNPDMCRAAIDCIAVSLTAIASSVAGDDLEGMTLCCSFSKPDYFQRYQAYLPYPVEFGADSNSVFIPRRLLSTANPIASKANYQQAMLQCQSMLQSLAVESTSTTNRVKEILLSGPPGTIDEVQVAHSLFISKRTLGRRLTTEGTTFQTIKDNILADIAATQLLQRGTTIESVATLLNYHDASNFRRAFKRWFGKTPEQFRREDVLLQ